jgi:GLPGLI family protein
MLIVSKKSSIYFSHLKQFGNRNLENDVMKNNFNTEQLTNNRGSYFTRSETEVITKDFKNKQVTFADEIVQEHCYSYQDSLKKPIWKLEKDTITVLGHVCQKATTFFKGRYFTAWFAKEINISDGPWLFYGLPGLILKVNDDKMQFSFECISLAPKLLDSKYFRAYSGCKVVKKEALKEMKRFKAQNPIKFMETTTGKTVTQTGGNVSMYSKALKPYNPIDLTQ